MGQNNIFGFGWQKVGTTVVSPTITTLFDGLVPLNDKGVFIYNSGPATFVNCVVEVSGDGGRWGTLDGTTFTTTGSNVMLFTRYDAPYNFIRIRAAVATGSVATCFWQVNY